MRKALFFLTFFTLAFNCDKIEKLNQVDLTTTISQTYLFELSETAESFKTVKTFSIEEKPELTDYLDRIESIEISKASYRIRDYVGENEVSGEATASIDKMYNFGPYTHKFMADAQNQTVFNMDDATKLSTIALRLKNNKKVTVELNGTLDSAPIEPVSFKVDVTMNLKVKAKAI